MKAIPGFSGYFADKQGNIFTGRRVRKTSALISPRLRKGYLAVSLYTPEGRKTQSVHTLVLETFIGSPKEGQEARHLNGNPLDNRLKNLAWSSHQQNILDKEAHGTKPTKEKHGMSKLTESKVRKIRELFNKGYLQKEIATLFKMSTSQINNIVRNKHWRDV